MAHAPESFSAKRLKIFFNVYHVTTLAGIGKHSYILTLKRNLTVFVSSVISLVLRNQKYILNLSENATSDSSSDFSEFRNQ